MQPKEVLLILTDKWADWEASYAVAVINSFSEYDIKVKTAAINSTPLTSMGGLRTEIDYTLGEYNNFHNLSMIIMPGGLSWKDNDYPEIVDFVNKVSGLNISVAAICGATIFLGRNGLLNNVYHTGDEFEFFAAYEKYKGEAFFKPVQVVVDGGFITANETAAVEFAYEIFKTLKIDEPEGLDIWYKTFKNGMFNQ